MSDDFKEFGSYRIGVNLPMNEAPIWEKVARAARWGAPVVELNASVERVGKAALDVVKQLAEVNDIKLTMHIPPDPREAGELALPDKAANQFAVDVLKQSLNAAANTGVKHITFHATQQAGRPPKDVVYYYDVMQEQLQPARVPQGMKNDEFIKMLNESSKAKFETETERMRSNMSLINQMEESAKRIVKEGVSTDTALDLVALSTEATTKGSYLGIQPDNMGEWSIIQNKITNEKSLNEREKQAVKDYALKVNNQVGNYKTMITAGMKQREQFVGKELVRDGMDFMMDNVAKNIASVPKDTIQKAMNKGVTIGIENLSGQQIFSTPQELNELRRRVVNKLVDKGFTKEAANTFVGFTFDFGHANITKNLKIGDTQYTLPEFVKALEPGTVKHVHATDAIGVIDAHLPLGHGEVTRKEMEKVEEALGKSFTSVHELGAGIPQVYHASIGFYDQGMYNVGGAPTSSIWGPTYLSAAMTDPITMQKEGGYFYESFVDLF